MARRTVTARDPKPTAERIEPLAERVLTGDIILPEFQRPFVWKRKQILELVDSIYRNYPIGSMLLWESRQKLASKRSIADLQVGERSPNYPVNYLLDGTAAAIHYLRSALLGAGRSKKRLECNIRSENTKIHAH